MKIAFILYGKADDRSGGYLYDSYLIHHLKLNRHFVKVFPQEEGNLFSLLMQNRIDHFNNLVDFNPDIIIEDELNHVSLFLINRQLKSRLKAPILTVVHHLRSDEKINNLNKFLIKMIETLYLKTCDAFIFNSKNTLDRVSALLKRETMNYRIIYPGKDNLPLFDRENQNSCVTFLYAGNIIPRKNLDMVIKVLHKLTDFEWHFNICGSDSADPAYARKLMELSQNLVRDKKVFFRGRLSNEELSRLMSISDFLLAPSDHEGFGIIYLEAMRAGVIPVASAKGGAQEIIENGVNGFLISPDNSMQLEELLRNILNNPELIKKTRAELKKRADFFSTWDDTMKNGAAFIEGIVFSETR
ncbi:MAG: glycosyltransferase family 4 protein [Spirochaetia bacterium]|jgi:glycosyltransferase involved in cell wall biosynthesis|nr:glycosyltransferase family 4 protein [Spirochaetia bacterium]